jgi:hypothetical protein
LTVTQTDERVGLEELSGADGQVIDVVALVRPAASAAGRGWGQF